MNIVTAMSYARRQADGDVLHSDHAREALVVLANYIRGSGPEHLAPQIVATPSSPNYREVATLRDRVLKLEAQFAKVDSALGAYL